MSASVPYLTYEDICAAAEEFLAEHKPEGDIPVLIEEIIEFGLELEIRPVRGLQDRFGFEGAPSHDLLTILVDETVMETNLNRYRFTLAHEVGHRILHGSFISSLTYTDKEDWKRAVMDIDPKIYGRMESQAYIMAGCILVPRQSLRASCEDALMLAQQHGIDLTEMGTSAISYVAGHIAKHYKVSTAVMERRISAENIFEIGSQ